MPQAIFLSSTIYFHKKKTKTKAKSIKRKNKLFILSFLFLSFIFLSLLIFYLYLNLSLVEINFNLGEKEEKLVKLQAETRKLEIKLEKMSSVSRLKKKAQKFKLAKPTDVRYLEIKASSVLSFERSLFPSP